MKNQILVLVFSLLLSFLSLGCSSAQEIPLCELGAERSILNSSQEEISANAKVINYFIEPHPSGMAEISYAETVRRVDKGLRELGAVCNLHFVKLDKSGGARLKISFHPEHLMPHKALGVAWSSGKIWLNSTRKVGLTNPYNRVAEAVTIHETMHVLNFNHSSESCIMGPNLTARYFCRQEVIELQRKYGIPGETWYPADKTVQGDKLRTLQAELYKLQTERERLIKLRDSKTDRLERSAIQVQVLENVGQIRAVISKMQAPIKEWKRLKAYWGGLPKVGCKVLQNKSLALAA